MKKQIWLTWMVLLQTGCATILQSGPDKIPVASSPSGADVYLNGHKVGQTPMTVAIRRDEDAMIEVKKSGFGEERVELHKNYAGWMTLDLLLGQAFLIGVIVDLAAHNQGKYPEDPLNLNLTSQAHAAQEPSLVLSSRAPLH